MWQYFKINSIIFYKMREGLTSIIGAQDKATQEIIDNLKRKTQDSSSWSLRPNTLQKHSLSLRAVALPLRESGR